MIPDPQRSVKHRAEEHDAARPPVDEVEFLVSVPGPQQERNHRVLACKEEHDGKLSERDESYVYEEIPQWKIEGCKEYMARTCAIRVADERRHVSHDESDYPTEVIAE